MENIEYPLSKNNHTYHTFLGHVYCKPRNGTIDLNILAKEFPLDVKVDPTKTMILQGSNIVDKPFEICSTRYKNKKINYESSGFTKKSYPRSPEIMAYSYPPELVPIGCYCKECEKQGPYLHSETCPKPKKTSLFLTLDGFVNSIFIKKDLVELDEENSELFVEFYNKLNTFIKFIESKIKKSKKETVSADVYKSLILQEIEKEEYSEFFNNEKTLTNISINVVSSLTKKDSAKFFAGPVMIKFKKSDGDVTIRIRPDATIELISNPWSNRDLYMEIIKRINKGSQKVVFKNIEIRSFFCSVNLFEVPKKFDMQKVFSYFWPLNKSGFPVTIAPKEEIVVSNKTVYFIRGPKENGQEKFYNYFIHTDKYSKNRIYMELITMSIDKSAINLGPYKINIQLFAQGHLQITFGYYNNVDGFENIDDQFLIIKNIVEDVQKLFLYHLSKMISDDNTSVSDIIQKQPSKKIYETIGGSIPYAKKKKFKIGDQVQEFSMSKMKWRSSIGTIVKINEKIYTIEFKRNTKIITKNLEHLMIRNIEENNDQVCRLKENGVQKQPIPYSFLNGKCPGGLNQIIKPIGAVSRTDNRQYPFCMDVKKGDEEWVINFLMNGLTKEERKEGLIPKGSVDNFCGVFIPGTAQIGSNIVANIDGWKNVQILEKYKTHGLGNDKIVVNYKVVHEGEEFEITGEQFHKSHVENRNYEGLPKGREKEILINAATKLHLIKPSITLGPSELEYTKFNSNKLLLFSSKDIDYVYNNKYFCSVIPEVVSNLNKCTLIIKDNKCKLINEDTKKVIRQSAEGVENIIINGFFNGKKFYTYEVESSENYKLRYHKLNNCFSTFESLFKKMNIDFQPLTHINLEQNIELFLKQKVINDPIYSDLKNTIVFTPRSKKDNSYIYSDKKIRTITVKLLSSTVNNLWTCSVEDPEFKKFFEENKIKFVGNKGDYVSIKPNVMLDGYLNPNDPIIDVKVSTEEKYNNSKMILRHILYPVSPSMLVKLNN